MMINFDTLKPFKLDRRAARQSWMNHPLMQKWGDKRSGPWRGALRPRSNTYQDAIFDSLEHMGPCSQREREREMPEMGGHAGEE